jgi:hypothetical protein
VAGRRSALNGSQGGKTATANNTSITTSITAALLLVRFHYLILAPLIILGVPSQIFQGLGFPILLIIIALGLSGMLARKQVLMTLASVGLLALLVAGKVGTDLAKAPAPDTAVLLLEFIAIIFFMEASRVVLSYDKEKSKLTGRSDDMSQAARGRLGRWVIGQLSRQARLVVGALGLSLILLVLGGFTSVSIDQLSFSAILVLLVVGALLFLITQRREPETRTTRLA